MSPPSKKRIALARSISIRHFGVEIETQTDGIHSSTRETQTNHSFFREKNMVDASTQTIDFHSTHKSIMDNFAFDHVNLLVDLLIDSIAEWNAIAGRILSVMIYMILRLCGIKYQITREILQQLNLLSIFLF